MRALIRLTSWGLVAFIAVLYPGVSAQAGELEPVVFGAAWDGGWTDASYVAGFGGAEHPAILEYDITDFAGGASHVGFGLSPLEAEQGSSESSASSPPTLAVQWTNPAPESYGPTWLSYLSEGGDYIGQGETNLYTPADGSFNISRNADEGVSLRFRGASIEDDWWSADFAAPGDALLVPGLYEGATRFPFQEPDEPGLDFSGCGRGSNTLTGRFEVLCAEYGPGGEVLRFGVNFEQHSEGAEPALFGKIRYNMPSSVEAAPTLDALADFSGGESVVIDGESTVNVQQVDFADVDRRGVLEFDISAVPDGATITSAAIELDIAAMTYSSDTWPVLYLHGYAGNGTLELADGQAPLNLIGQSDPITDLGMISINLDVDYIESLLAVTDYLGLLALGDENYKQAGFVTIEGEIPGVRYAPKLAMQFDILPLRGDLNTDGFAGQSDLDIVLAMWGRSGGDIIDPRADVNDDDFVGQTDLDYVLGDWGQGTPLGAPVPEPATLGIFALCGFVLLRRKPKSQ